MNLPEPIAFPPLTRTDLVRYAGASGDFNPLHHDHAFARDAGLPDVMAHGMLSAGLLGTALTRWFGADRIARYAVRFRSPVWPGDQLTARCESEAAAEDDPACTDVEIVLLRSGDDDIVLSGSARVRAQATIARENEGP
jgi:acyl dehydratase